MFKRPLSPFATAVGAAFLAATATSPIVSAADVFSAEPLPAGYNLAAADLEGQCGTKKVDHEGKCGEDGKAEATSLDNATKEIKEDKVVEESKETKETKADREGKCGEGMCGH